MRALTRSHDVAGWVLYPTRDETVAAIARHRQELSALFRVPTPGWDVIALADDKRNTYDVAERLKIPIPRSSTPGSIDAFDPVAEPGPWAIKPAIKERFIYETKKKAWRADDEGQLRDAFRRAAEIVGPDEAIIQELIPGDGRHQVAFCALCDQGRTVAEMTVRRLRQHPPEFGRASTFAESVDLPEVATSARRFLQAMRCHGLVEVEFKLDPRDGRYKLLDVNARTWGYHTLGARAGVDFPYLLYRSAIGQPVPSTHARAGVGWVRLLTDVPTALGETLGGPPLPPGVPAVPPPRPFGSRLLVPRPPAWVRGARPPALSGREARDLMELLTSTHASLLLDTFRIRTRSPVAPTTAWPASRHRRAGT